MSTEILQYYVDEIEQVYKDSVPVVEKYRSIKALSNGFEIDDRLDTQHPDYMYVAKLLYVEAMNYKLQYLTREPATPYNNDSISTQLDSEILDDLSLDPDLR